MSIYDYMTNFWFKNEYDQCSLSEIALYYCLLHEANRQHWVSPFKVGTQMLVTRLGSSKQNILKAREGLMQKGLITYISGKGKGRPTFYTLSLNTTANNEHSQVLPQTLTQEVTPALTQALTQMKTEALTSALPLSNKKEEDIIRDEKKGANVPPSSPRQKVLLTLDELQAKLLGGAEWLESLSGQLDKDGIHLYGDALKGKIVEFFDDLRGRNITHKEEADCRSHVYNWIKYHVKNSNYGQDRKHESKVGRIDISNNRPEDYQGAC